MASLLGEGFDRSNLQLGFTASIFTVLLPFLGWGVGWFMKKFERNYQNSTSHLGLICLNEREMGPFVARGPGTLRYFWPWCFPITSPPTLLTVSALIAAGDDGVFSSSIFTNQIEPNHDTVSWKKVYEAFFHQYVPWARQYGLQVPPPTKDSAIDMALSAAQKPTQQYACEKLYLDRRPKTTLCHNHGNDKIPVSPNVDSELGSGKLESRGPVLICGQKLPSMKHLENGKSAYTVNFHPPVSAQSWLEDAREAWIHAGHPSIEVSKEELAALSLFIGIPLHAENREFLPSARGPFGITLTSEMVQAITTIRLVFGPRGVSSGKPLQLAKGSGYSTLFAKHMACGCLPFAQLVTHDPVTNCQGVDTQTIMITDDVKRALESGGAINSGEVELYPREFNYLLRLPSSGTTNFYLNHGNPENFSQGTLVEMETPTRPIEISTWWEAVAGIPFGGLVPRVTPNLRDIVRFTLGGYIKCPDLENPQDLDPLFHLITVAAMKSEKLTSIDVFGHTKHSDGPGVAKTRDIEDCDPRFTVETLNCFMTLFEHLMAIAAINGNLDAVGVVRHVHRSLQSKLKLAYDAAVKHSPPQTTLEVLIKGEGGLAEMVERRSIKVADCAEAAMCILVGWTSLVALIRWIKGDKGAVMNPEDLNKAADGRDTGYFPPFLRELPDVSAWC